ncbi:MAG TPA: hypothetical protein VF039_00365 [Longimicrobiales bacterium]
MQPLIERSAVQKSTLSVCTGTPVQPLSIVRRHSSMDISSEVLRAVAAQNHEGITGSYVVAMVDALERYRLTPEELSAALSDLVGRDLIEEKDGRFWLTPSASQAQQIAADRSAWNAFWMEVRSRG